MKVKRGWSFYISDGKVPLLKSRKKIYRYETDMKDRKEKKSHVIYMGQQERKGKSCLPCLQERSTEDEVRDGKKGWQPFYIQGQGSLTRRMTGYKLPLL